MSVTLHTSLGDIKVWDRTLTLTLTLALIFNSSTTVADDVTQQSLLFDGPATVL